MTITIATNDQAIERALAWCVSLDAKLSTTARLVALSPVVAIVGPDGNDQEWLARQIHAATSPEMPFHVAREARRPVPSGTTVYVDTSRVPRVSRTFAASLSDCRAIVAARSMRDSARAWDDMHPPLTVRLTALRGRRNEVPRLLDRLLAEHGHRLAEIPPADVETLMRYTWPGNLGELRQVARRMCALLDGGNLTRAAARLEISRAALAKFLNRRRIGEWANGLKARKARSN
jgi:transcriptional regulator with AAA-type ATPase domain